jgi:hypothetical protein
VAYDVEYDYVIDDAEFVVDDRDIFGCVICDFVDESFADADVVVGNFYF